MTNFSLRLDDAAEYQSFVEVDSTEIEGVRFRVRRISAGRRSELMRRVRSILQRVEFHEAGSSPSDRLEGSLLSREVDRMYLEACIDRIEGLTIDGESARVETLWELGPEALTMEMVDRAKQECHLSDHERKN